MMLMFSLTFTMEAALCFNISIIKNVNVQNCVQCEPLLGSIDISIMDIYDNILIKCVHTVVHNSLSLSLSYIMGLRVLRTMAHKLCVYK